jgi:hypothetical protein
VAPSLLLTVRRRNVLQTWTNSILVKGFGIRERGVQYTQDPVDSVFRPSMRNNDLGYGLLRFVHNDKRTFNPYSYTAEAQLGKQFAKLTLEGKLRLDYNTPGKSFFIRAFAGKFISRTSGNETIQDRYYLNATPNGRNDYLYEEVYFGRNETEGIAAQQISGGKEGGFKLPTPYYSVPLGRSDDLMFSLNLKSDLPLKSLPVRAFFDVMTYSNAAKISPTSAKMLYEGGLELYIGTRFSLHLPLILSRDYTDYLKSVHGDDAFWKRLTFSLNLTDFVGLRSGTGDFKL